jgi:hypothetical protein
MKDLNINIRITNIPDSKDYFDKAEEIFVETFDMLLTLIYWKINPYPEELEEEVIQEIRDTKKTEIKIMTNLHHILEIYLSGLILESNPLKLIKLENITEDIELDFDSLPSIQAYSLYEVAKKNISESYFNETFLKNDLKSIYERNRKLRNKNMHSIVRNFKNINHKNILVDFLSIWFFFFKKRDLVKDFYKIIFKEKFFLEDKTIRIMVDDSEYKNSVNKKFLENFNKKIKKRMVLVSFFQCIKELTSENEFKEIINYNQKTKSYCTCPNCYTTLSTDFELGYFDFEINRFEPEQNIECMTKTLMTNHEGTNAFCYLCGYKITKKQIHKKYCKSCKKDTFFNKFKLKVLNPYNEIKKEYDFCLYCGSSNNELSNSEDIEGLYI